MTSPSHAASLEVLYLQHHRWLVGRLRHKLGCAWDASDLAQDTFVRVLGALTLSLPVQKIDLPEIAVGC